VNGDYKDGYSSGKMHGVPRRYVTPTMLRDNLRKIEEGMKSSEPRIRQYWTGYRDGMVGRRKA